jgi:hypothetical protein
LKKRDLDGAPILPPRLPRPVCVPGGGFCRDFTEKPASFLAVPRLDERATELPLIRSGSQPIRIQPTRISAA